MLKQFLALKRYSSKDVATIACRFFSIHIDRRNGWRCRKIIWKNKDQQKKAQSQCLAKYLPTSALTWISLPPISCHMIAALVCGFPVLVCFAGWLFSIIIGLTLSLHSKHHQAFCKLPKRVNLVVTNSSRKLWRVHLYSNWLTPNFVVMLPNPEETFKRKPITESTWE